MSNLDREFRKALLSVIGAFVVIVVMSGWSRICEFSKIISESLMTVAGNSLALILHNPTQISLILLLVLAVTYFIPSFVAAAASRRNVYPIFLCNLLFGWTVLGWSITLLWAAMKDSA